jgi:transposase-like protein
MNPSSMFCPNPDCPLCGKRGEGNIGVHSQKARRYCCATCGRTFSERKGSPFYRLRTAEERVTLAVTLLGHG